ISVGLICFALGVYYLRLGCLQYDGAPFALNAGNWWKLLRPVVAQLWPLETQTGLLTIAYDFFFLTALAMPWLLWRKRNDLAEPKKFVLAVSITATIQILCAILLGTLVVRTGYYFIGRIFIYLISLRVVLVVCGGYWCVYYFSEQWKRVL